MLNHAMCVSFSGTAILAFCFIQNFGTLQTFVARLEIDGFF